LVIAEGVLANPRVGKESIGRLRGRPILAGERDAAPNPLRELFEQYPKALAMTHVVKSA